MSICLRNFARERAEIGKCGNDIQLCLRGEKHNAETADRINKIFFIIKNFMDGASALCHSSGARNLTIEAKITLIRLCDVPVFGRSFTCVQDDNA